MAYAIQFYLQTAAQQLPVEIYTYSIDIVVYQLKFSSIVNISNSISQQFYAVI